MTDIITLEKEVCKLASGSVVVRVRTDDIGIGTHKIKAIEKIINDCFEERFNLKYFEKEFNSPEFKGEKWWDTEIIYT